MGPINFPLSTSVLEWARVSMGYTVEQAAEKADVPVTKYESWEKGKTLPTYRQLETLAEKVYKRPIAILMLKSPPIETPIQSDFRTVSNIELKNMGPDLRLAIRRAKRYQLIVQEVDDSHSKIPISEFKIDVQDDPIDVSRRFREFLKLSVQEQKSWKEDESHRLFRRILESTGIYTFQMSFPMSDGRAFCLTGDVPVIVLNSNDSKKGSIFSMFHEACHILLNENDIFRDKGPDQTSKKYDVVEKFCNEFAAAFLVPDDAFESDIIELRQNRSQVQNVISRLARHYNVSHEVIARKLLTRELLDNDSFWNMKRMWDSQAQLQKEKNKKPNDSGIDQSIKVLFEKGRLYTSKILSAYQSGTISSSDLLSYLETKSAHIQKIIERLS